MINRAGDTIWAMAAGKRRGPSGRGPDSVTPLTYEQEQARRRRAWELRGQQNEDLDREWAEPPPEPEDPTNIGQLLDREYARHQRRFRSWDYPIFDPSPKDDSLPREEWDDRVRKFLVNPTKAPSGALVAKDPHALVGQDAVMGVRSALMKEMGDGITNRGVAERIRAHYMMGRPQA